MRDADDKRVCVSISRSGEGTSPTADSSSWSMDSPLSIPSRLVSAEVPDGEEQGGKEERVGPES